MTTTSELDKIKERIRRLAAMTTDNGCSENEAMNAAVLAGQLLLKYNMTIDDVSIKDEKCARRVHTFSFPDRTMPIHGVIMPIATFCDCRIWFNAVRLQRGSRIITGTSGFTAVGLDHDVEMALYLYKMLEKTLENELRVFLRSSAYSNAPNKKSARTSFQHGLVDRVGARLLEIKRANQRIESKNALVVSKTGMIEQTMSELGIKLREKKTYTRATDSSSYHRGAERGNAVNINRPLN